MGFGETFTAVAFACVTWAMVVALAEVVKRYLAYKERRLEVTAGGTAEKAAQYAAQMERMEQRMRVLERLATDRGADLALEIETLREPAALPARNVEKERI